MDTRSYLQCRIAMHEADQERRRKAMERIGYVVAMIGMAALWIAGWMFR